MRTTKWAVALGTLAFASAIASSVFAQDPKWYVGGAVGQSDARQACDGIAIPCDRKDTAWKLIAGYQVNRNFGVEAGYSDLGKATANGVFTGVSVNASAKSTAWELVGIGAFPVADKFSLYGKLGVYRAKTDVSATGAVPGFSVTLSPSDTNTDWTAGFGAMYDINRNVGVRAEWQRYNKVGGDNTGKSDVDVLGLGLLYRF